MRNLNRLTAFERVWLGSVFLLPAFWSGYRGRNGPAVDSANGPSNRNGLVCQIHKNKGSHLLSLRLSNLNAASEETVGYEEQ